MPYEITTLARTSYHEAGHSAAAATLGLCTGADVIARDGRLGVCSFKRVTDPIEEIAVALSGPLAAWQAAGRRGELFYDGCADDLRAVDAAIERHHGSPIMPRNREAYLAWVLGLKLARKIVAENWGAVQHIAEWLQKNKVASMRLIHACVAIGKVPKSGDFQNV